MKMSLSQAELDHQLSTDQGLDTWSRVMSVSDDPMPVLEIVGGDATSCQIAYNKLLTKRQEQDVDTETKFYLNVIPKEVIL